MKAQWKNGKQKTGKVSENDQIISKLGSNVGDSKNERLSVLYTRTSSIDQKTDRQRIDENKYDLVLEDKISGSVEFFLRPSGSRLKAMVDSNSVSSIDIWSIDRAGRNLLDILQTLKYLTNKKVQVNFVSQGLKTLDEDGNENPIAKMVIGILGIIAEMTRTQTRESQAQGIALAKARGVYKGRKQNTKETTLQFLSKPKNSKALELLRKGYKGSEVAKIVQISPTTVCKVKRLGINQ